MVLSYEMALVTGLLCLWVVRHRFRLSPGAMIILAGAPVLFCTLVSLGLRETLRRPFDLVEAESELVSGFNVEYRGGGFVLLFLREYASLLFVCQFIAYLAVPIGCLTSLLGLVLTRGILAARAAYPRVKTSSWINVCWSLLVPWCILALGLSLILWVAGLYRMAPFHGAGAGYPRAPSLSLRRTTPFKGVGGFRGQAACFLPTDWLH